MEEEGFVNVPIPSDDEDEEGVGETFEEAMAAQAPPPVEPVVLEQPTVVEDYLLSLFVKHGFHRTLQKYDLERWEKKRLGGAQEEGERTRLLCADAHQQNKQLEEECADLEKKLARELDVAAKSGENLDAIRRERDFHQDAFRRLKEENSNLRGDVQRINQQLEKYPPLLKKMKDRYYSATQSKMMSKLEMDGLKREVLSLEGKLKQMENPDPPTPKAKAPQSTLPHKPPLKAPVKSSASAFKEPAQPGAWAPRTVFKGTPPVGVSCLSVHPKRPLACGGADDGTWRAWTLSSGEPIIKATGHTDFVSGVSFHTQGSILATCSGDTSVRLWDMEQAECKHVFKDFSSVVWGCQAQEGSDLLATCSADKTIRIMDMKILKCRCVLNGHVNDVNKVIWRPGHNEMASCGADRTVSLWDLRRERCTATLFQHNASVWDVSFAADGYTAASCDCRGKVVQWDLRVVGEKSKVNEFDCGPYPANSVSLDPTGSFLAVGCEDSGIKVFQINGSAPESEWAKPATLKGNSDGVLSTHFEPNFILSSCSDGSVRLWS